MKLRGLMIVTVLAVFAQGGFAQGGFAQAGNVSQRQADRIIKQAENLSEKEKYNEAIALLLKNKEVFIKAGDSYYASAANELGSLYQAIEDYAKAEACYLEAKAIYEKMPGKNNTDYAMLLFNMGLLYDDMEDYVKAEPCYLESKAIYERALGKEHPVYAILLSHLGLLYYNTGVYAKAGQYLLEAKAVNEKAFGKNHLVYAESLTYLGVLYRTMGDYTKAKQYLLEAKVVSERLLGKNHSDYASSLNNLGELYLDMGDYAKAEECYLEAKAINEKSKNHPVYAASLNNLGELYQYMGDYARAEPYCLEAKAVYEQTLGKNHSNYAMSLNSLGNLYNYMGNYAKALPYYLEAKAVWERTLGKNHSDYASSLNNLGELYRSMGDYAKAEACYLEVKAIFEQSLGKNHPIYAKSLNNLGELYQDKRDYSRAEAYYLEVKAVFEKALGKNHPDYAYFLNNMDTLYQNTGNYAKAEAYNKELCELRINLIKQNFTFMSEQQRGFYLQTVSRNFEASYSLSRRNPVETVNGLNYTNTLFTKGLLLRTTNAVRDAIYSSGNKTLIGQFEQLGGLRQQISALRQKGGDEAYLQSLETQADALDKELTRASASFRDLEADIAMQWQNVRDSLKPGEAAIEFVSFQVYDEKWTDTVQYAALVLRPGMNAPEWVPLCEENTLTEIFAKLDGKRPQEQARILYDEYGSSLYNAIWRPLEKILEGVTTVYYSPSGLLHKVAFNAIPVNADTRLMDKYNLNMVSSTREVVYIRNRAMGKPGSAVVYGGLDYTVDADTMRKEALAYNTPGTRSGSSRDGMFEVVDTVEYQQKTSGGTTWGYLQYTDIESRSIHDLLTANRVPADLYNGVKGNKESFISLDGKKTMVIHLATHGFFNQDIKKDYEEQTRLQQMGGKQKAFENPLRRSGLILAGANTWAKNPVEGTENGILLADEVAGMNLLGADLVVLSACETALGEVNNSEGVFGLQRAFKLAGAQTLIMSLWKVDDEATSILISEFYRNWLAGKSKQEAFKEAQRKLRSNPQYVSPFYWAAFVMMD